VNKQEREIESLRNERDLLLSDKTIEEKLRIALEERDQAIKRYDEFYNTDIISHCLKCLC